MIFIKQTLQKLAITPLFGMLFMSGCGSLPLIGEKTPSEEPEQAVASSEQVVEQPAEVLPPNPYLQSRKSVPTAAQKRFATALEFMDSGEWQKAEQPLLQITIDYPQLSGAHLNLGICYRQLGKEQLAQDYFTESIRVNPSNLSAYNLLALVKREQGAFAEAKALYEKALAVWPYHPESHYNLGVLNELYLGDLQSASHHFGQYQKLLPEPDKRVAGWIKDLQRRINALAENKVAP
ncbi:tetratricopeptide repeat protein [Porticoccus sp. W117]|uniref:tetratricopeptide repeat protein n=1 Tax=Porticoccus sp. W117 TaxID=3054777 RepID=UPI00259A3BB4|nr:tetratricopeptide repeat protein [Porticoccus sp. W117]MDM3872239.1 tetratricopeptide repeat protein [Porticoccus sp. W117]